MNNQFANGYAEALFDLALEKNNIETINEQFKLLVKALHDQEEFIKILSHPQLGKEEKKEMIKTVFNSLDSIMIHFLFVLIDNDRISSIYDVREAFIKIYNEFLNIIYVKAYTTVNLDKTQMDRLKVKLMIKYRHKIEIINLVDPSLIGGMKIVVNEDVIDFTVNNQLKNLKSHVLKQI